MEDIFVHTFDLVTEHNDDDESYEYFYHYYMHTFSGFSTKSRAMMFVCLHYSFSYCASFLFRRYPPLFWLLHGSVFAAPCGVLCGGEKGRRFICMHGVILFPCFRPTTIMGRVDTMIVVSSSCKRYTRQLPSCSFSVVCCLYFSNLTST